ncbi:uncharacterized protein LOC134249601 [Saccostrea cucullata]|uniref:uncharacterized protein LOC134249601 n=1 Tax=Saccostrea cuccullata TaxID=36930 RepID=UPI002ED0D23A
MTIKNSMNVNDGIIAVYFNQCLMGWHKKHEFTDINAILQEHKEKIISDTEELEKTIVPKYRHINLCTTAEFDKGLSAIKEQEDKICQAVHKKSTQLTEETQYKVLMEVGQGCGEFSVWGEIRSLISGNDKTIKEIDRAGSILQTIHTNNDVLALTLNSHLEPVFSLHNAVKQNTDIYIYTRNEMNVLFNTLNWFPVGLCYKENGDLLNGNGDICVADYEKKAVVVVDSSGDYDSKYPCDGGLSIDADHNLVIGKEGTRIIQIIKYLE